MNQRKLEFNPTQVRRSGFGKGLFATLFLVSAGAAYIENTRRQHVVTQDPSSRTGKYVSRSVDSFSERKDGVVDDLERLGQHVKQSAQVAGQALHESLDETKKEGTQWAHQVKQDTRDAFEQAKESTQDAYDHLQRQGSTSAKEEAYDQLKREGSRLKKDAQETYDQLKRDGANLMKDSGDALDQAVNETDSKLARFKSEHHLKEGTRSPEDVVSHTTTTDTPVQQARNHIFDRASIAHGNPMVHEKHSAQPTKPGWERRMEEYAEKTVRDTSTLVGKDSEKVRGVWEDKAARALGRTPRPQETSEESFWSHLFGQATEKAHAVENKLEQEWQGITSRWGAPKKEEVSDIYSKAKSDLHSKTERAKDDVSHKASQVKNDIYNKTDSLYNKAESVKDDVSDSIKNKATQAKKDIYNKTDSLYSKAESVKDDVSDSIKDKANEVEKGVYKKTDSLYSKAGELKNSISSKTQDVKEKAQDLYDSASESVYDGSIHDLHKEVSANASKWKKQSEQTAKSWYEKSANQVKGSLGAIKTTADKDLEWAGQKVQDGIASAKDGVERIFDKSTDKKYEGLKGHIIRGEKIAEEEMENLRGTRTHVKLAPAEVIVGNAHGKDM